ncbi:phytanoyl-CoA dioxygenase family protein [Novosphingobium sp. KN65.2]|uniref:phytanoyl-CoA dioxygenase family protein n=1 Tax=Novosphingobium sp. KN65.2 TaxID=1478134 RepID=UPI0018D0D6AC|nr:phytanoyl-CoA dioxygenase family protein [Novosphingobium sp. KN65.2]
MKMANSTLQDPIEEARLAYQRDGAAVLRGVVPAEWIERLARATDRILERQSGTDINKPGDGRFFAGFFPWLEDADYAAFVNEGPLGELAGKLMGSRHVRFFYDQLLVKEPGSSKRTPWHQDLPYWPVLGNDIISIWVPMDVATPENGVVTYVRGSHLWDAFFPQEKWNEGSGATAGSAEAFDVIKAPNGASIADIRDHPESYEFLTWNLEPGDVLIHHPLTVHGAPGNLSSTSRRRAVATRWFGDDVRWMGSGDNFMRRLHKMQPDFPFPELADGARPVAPVFPLVWQLT